jgi:hypothetical protein
MKIRLMAAEILFWSLAIPAVMIVFGMMLLLCLCDWGGLKFRRAKALMRRREAGRGGI